MNHINELQQLDYINLTSRIRRSFGDSTVIGTNACATIRMKTEETVKRLQSHICTNNLPMRVESNEGEPSFKILWD